MSYPLIILGAGASHDYSSKGKHAPLTNQLVQTEYQNINIVRRYNGSSALLSEIENKIKKGGKTFEEALTVSQEEMKGISVLERQFIALEFYLQELFKDISTSGGLKDVDVRHEFNNYKILVSCIYKYCGGKACIVTFNYDTLLERNLTENIPDDMNDYIQHGIKIIKLHGSHDWVYVQRKDSLLITDHAISAFDLCCQNTSFLNKIRIDGRTPEHIKQMDAFSKTSDYFRFPAIAVPLVGKDKYVCPDSHVKVLENELDNVDRILVIGWKAGDTKLLETIKKHPNYKNCKILVISASFEGAERIVKTLKETLMTTFIEAYKGDFSDFMGDDASSDFFR